MTQEEKQLLLRDLCARLPYGVKVQQYLFFMDGYKDVVLDHDILFGTPLIEEIKPYLRPMSSMTKEEEKTFSNFLDFQAEYVSDADLDNKIEMFDWLNAHHFDYRGLIEKGLALEAPEGMYK